VPRLLTDDHKVQRFSVWKSPKRKWQQKSFEKYYYQWQDMGLWLWCWNQTTVLTLEEFCFVLPQETTAGSLAIESKAPPQIIEAVCIINSLLKVRQSRFLPWFSDVCGMQYEKNWPKMYTVVSGFLITIMCLLTQHYQLDSFWQNIQFLPFQGPPLYLTSPLPTVFYSLNSNN
jgi:hypothetical protein